MAQSEIRIAKDFLEYLSDEKWHSKFPIGVDTHAVAGCVCHEFVETKKIEEKVKGCNTAFRITDLGKIALYAGSI